MIHGLLINDFYHVGVYRKGADKVEVFPLRKQTTLFQAEVFALETK